MQTSQTVVRSWCQRLHEVAQAQAEAARLAGQTPPSGHAAGSLAERLGLVLHPGANVTAEYHQDYPGNFADQFGGLPSGPVTVDYLRIEEQTRPVSIAGYYRRQLHLKDMIAVKDGGWFDLVRTVPQTDRQRSIDVLITRVDPDPEREADEPEPVVMEILVVEAKDPTGG